MGSSRDESLDFSFAHLAWMTFVMKQDKTAYPIYVSLFCAIGVVFDALDICILTE